MGRPALVIEDDRNAAALLAAALRECRFQVCCAEDASLGLLALRGKPQPWLVLLDMILPGMDGWDFLRAKHADPGLAPIPVIIVTGHARLVSHENDVAAVVRKPIELPDLIRIIAHARAHREDGHVAKR